MSDNKLIKFLLFDFDGTLFDTKKANFVAYQKSFEKVGLKLSQKKYYAAYGLRFDEMIEKVMPGIPPEMKEDIRSTKAVFYKLNFGMIRKNSELFGFIDSAKKNHKVALVTTARKKNVLELLKFFGLESKFDVVVTGEDVKHGKPDPEGYLMAMERLGARPEQCLIFEDSSVGIEAATRSKANVLEVSF